MAFKTKEYIRSKFVTGAVPTQQDFEDLIAIIVSEINEKRHDQDGKVKTDFQIIETIRADMPPNAYPMGTSEFITNYESSTYAAYIATYPSLGQLMDGAIAVRTFRKPDMTLQEVDNIADGVFNASFYRLAIDDNTWGPITQGTSTERLKDSIPNIPANGTLKLDSNKNLYIDTTELGNELADGVTLSVNDQGKLVASGIGERGPIGPKGEQGDRGLQGIPGEQGPQGLQGETGPQGLQGIQGQRGEKGEGVNIGMTYNSVAEMNADIDNIPDNTLVFIVSGPGNPNNGELYAKVNGALVLSGELEGIQGPEGPEGPEGPQGLTGPQGPRGVQGTQGIQGPQGVRGEKGDTGATPTLVDATNTRKGVIQVGNGLSVNNGILSTASKQYLFAARENNAQSITAVDTTLIFNRNIAGNIPYTNTNGTFTLTAGKTYRITVIPEFTFNGTTGYIDIAVTNSSNGLVVSYNSTRYIPASSTSNEATYGPHEIFFTPTTTATYKVLVIALQGLTANMKHNTSRLLIQEL